MDNRLNQDLERFFNVFADRVRGNLHHLKATPETKWFDKKLCEEVELLRVSVMNRLEEHFTARL